MGNPRINTNIIEMNGKRYDAVTGSYLGDSLSHGAKPTVVHSVRSRGTSVDGFTKAKHGATPALAPLTKKPLMQYVSAPKLASAGQPHKPTQNVSSLRPAHTPGVHVSPHTPQRATTLMRSAVTKPVIKSPAMIKAQTRTDVLAKVPMQTVATKMSYNSINQVRHRRAERMIQSPAISRYGSGAPEQVATQTVYKVAAQPAPINRPAPTYRGAPRQVTDLRQVSPVAHARTQRPMSAPAALPVISAPSRHARPISHHDDIFEKALADAKSHEQTYDARNHKTAKRGRGLRYFAGGLVALLIVGFLVYQNGPNLSLKVASYRSGLHAKLPAKQPSGFTLGYLDYQPGNVTANFTSPQDSRQFNIKQKASNWDSQALLSNFVSTANSAYKTYQRAGRTVYLLGNNTATWVDSGVWYTIDGNSSLSSAQMLDVASSM